VKAYYSRLQYHQQTRGVLSKTNPSWKENRFYQEGGNNTLEPGTSTSFLKFFAIQQLAIKRWDEYGFVIHPVEVPKELPKVSMVNSCLKRLKSHLANFDMVVKERTTATAITEGTQMELAVEQHCEEKSKVQTKMENVSQENDRLLTQALSVKIVNIVVHDNVKFVCLNVNACARCVTTKSELKLDFLKKDFYETLLQKYQTLEKHCITLEINNQLNTKILQKDTLFSNASAPTFAELFEINDLKAQAQAKDTVILKLKETLNSLNGDIKNRDDK
nr:hypothetical protein [Tanacetum cinerariifolium]